MTATRRWFSGRGFRVTAVRVEEATALGGVYVLVVRVEYANRETERYVLPVATHAKAVREAVRSAWGQSSFDATPQLARLLYLSIAVSLSLGSSQAIFALHRLDRSSGSRRARRLL